MSATPGNDMTSDPEALESSFPMGMFDDVAGIGAANALRLLRIVEKIVRETSMQNALYARYSLLQSFPRFAEYEGLPKSTLETTRGIADFVRRYTLALAPSWYEETVSTLSDDETEVFLKNFLQGHETWGHPHGVARMVQSMLECSLHEHVPVRVNDLMGEERTIPDQLHSRLGHKESFSRLGKNFVLGHRVQTRPTLYEIVVGPITTAHLETFRRSGWADGTRPTQKLHHLVGQSEPFYLHGNVRFALEKVGFVAGKAEVGKSRLGVV
jgi:hypothetical protein